ncbi:MAG: hypothetical protein Q7U82_10375 [Gammaproteobacteria bacterium]|nr:hypothetical protein [Gammaproteobacteria bacterium]
MCNRPAVLFFLGCLTLSAAAHAQPDDSLWSFNGYGTLGAAHSSEHRADYIPNPVNSEGPGRSYRWDPLLDSRAAVQASVKPSDRLFGVVQVVVEKRFDGKFKPKVEWANLQYSLSPSFSVRAGRIALGTFMASDYRKVGYSLPWLRPPAELYQLVSITNSDGVDFTYRHDFDNSTYSVTAHYGSNKAKEYVGLLEATNIWGFVNHFERGALTLHASYISAKVKYGPLFQNLWTGFRAFGPTGVAVAQRYDATGKWSPFMAAGVGYDPGDWFVMAEWGKGVFRSDFDDRSGWYISGGYRVGAVSPYLTVARAAGGHRSVHGLNAADFPATLAPAISSLNIGLLDMQQGYAARQQTVSLGARWDVLPRVVTKLQIDHIKTRKDSIGTFNNMASGYRPRGADVVSLTVDFVF